MFRLGGSSIVGLGDTYYLGGSVRGWGETICVEVLGMGVRLFWWMFNSFIVGLE